MRAGRTPSDVLLFDLGGVLVDFRGFDDLAAMVPHAGGVEAVRERWLASPAVRAFEAGKIEPAPFARSFVAEWGLALDPAEFLVRFAAWARDLYPRALELLGRLRGRHRLACLSNANALHAELYRHALSPFFEATFFSFELGLLKPDPEIFATVVDRLGVAPARIVLFDDAEPNVRAARAAGLRAELVRGVDELERRIDWLARRGELARAPAATLTPRAAR